MGLSLSYMGTKREIAPSVADAIATTQAGSVLDVFAGMGSVGSAVGTARHVWTNDAQVFAAEVGAALFTSRNDPLGSVQQANAHHDAYARHRRVLCSLFERSLAAEDAFLESSDFSALTALRLALKPILQDEVAGATGRPHSLFCTIYADTFFGVRQSIEIDAIVASIASSKLAGRTTSEQRRWMTLGLGRAMIRCANSTGHFAQFLKPKETSYRKFLSQRRRSIWTEWLASTSEMSAEGTQDWRERNRSFCQDCLVLLPSLVSSMMKPAVVYADPPYTDDQYSRFYHVLETLILYDYPAITGAGMYRVGRFHTPFSIKSQTHSSLDRLAAGVAALGADFVLSYPTNGLLYEAGGCPSRVLQSHFREVEMVQAIGHEHSTFGASKGPTKASVIEQIFVARA